MTYEVFIPHVNLTEQTSEKKERHEIAKETSLAIQSHVYKLVGSNTTPPLGEPTAFRKTDQL